MTPSQNFEPTHYPLPVQVSLVHLVHLDLVAPLEPPLMAEQAHRVSQDLKARWDHQVSHIRFDCKEKTQHYRISILPSNGVLVEGAAV